MTLFAKEADFGVRYWASISTEKQSKNKKAKKQYVNASISATLSEDAKRIFKKNAEETKNEDVQMLRVEVKEFWLKAVEGRDGDFVVLFVNKIALPKEEEDDE